jgi:hypothetical protein
MSRTVIMLLSRWQQNSMISWRDLFGWQTSTNLLFQGTFHTAMATILFARPGRTVAGKKSAQGATQYVAEDRGGIFSNWAVSPNN